MISETLSTIDKIDEDELRNNVGIGGPIKANIAIGQYFKMSPDARSNGDDAGGTKPTARYQKFNFVSTAKKWFRKLLKAFREKEKTELEPTGGMDEEDIVIAIIGRVGEEGKILFLREAFGEESAQIVSSTHLIRRMVINSWRDLKQNLHIVFTTGDKDETLMTALSSVRSWLTSQCGKKKFSGLIYLEDASTEPPSKFTRRHLDLLDQCVEPTNIVIATTGWDDSVDMKSLEARHKELLDQWRTFVDRGVSVLKLSAPGKTSQHIYHTSSDIVELVITTSDWSGAAVKRAMWNGKGKKTDDEFMEDPRATDIVIPVMGPTGVGKTKFIYYLLGDMWGKFSDYYEHEGLLRTNFAGLQGSDDFETERLKLMAAYIFKPGISESSHRTVSQTKKLLPFTISHPTDHRRRIILVDTPGFDNADVSDDEILRRIGVWMAQAYSANMAIAGVIYLHDIGDTRMAGDMQKSLDLFTKLVGPLAMKNVIFASTNWHHVLYNVADSHERWLKNHHWKHMLDQGVRLCRFEGSTKSAWSILQLIIDEAPVPGFMDSVQIQQEMVELQKELPDTQAGRDLIHILEGFLERQRLANLQLRQAEMTDQVKAELAENEQKIRSTLKSISDLSGNPLKDLWRRLEFWSILQ